MKRVEAIIKPFKLDEVKDGLGKIFVSTIEDSIRIRTGETGSEAL